MGLELFFQRSTGVAIQALVYLAIQAPGKLSPTHEIAAQAAVPEAYLAKILQRLTLAGLVRAFRGSGKGVELGRPAEEIPLSSVIVAAQGSIDSDKCVLGFNACSEEHPCLLHSEWLPHRVAIQKMTESTTVADLVRFLRGSSAAVAPVAEAISSPADDTSEGRTRG
ncbi:MAG: Rrf2 family transcriptional regulator [Acidobacteria bacterium]|nr:Rrf2 family transcriptional regulator [Acidobacteriota bacterium]